MANPLPTGVTVVDIAITGGDRDFVEYEPHYFVLGSNGKVYSVGENTDGVGGVGASGSFTDWRTVRNVGNTGDLENVVFLSSADHTRYYSIASAIQADGQLVAWGYNSINFRAIGAGPVRIANTPIRPGNSESFRAAFVANSGHLQPVISQTGELCKVGHNTMGSFADGFTTGLVATNDYSCSFVAGQLDTEVCVSDFDGDGIPNTLDLDSDGDGCADAIEGGGAFDDDDLVNSSIVGGNSGADFNGSSSDPIIRNLGNTVSSSGIPNVAGAGQTLGVSQDGEPSVECAMCDTPPTITLSPANATASVGRSVEYNYTVANGPAMLFTNGGGTLSITATPADGSGTFTYTTVAGDVNVSNLAINLTIFDPDGASGPCASASENANLTVSASTVDTDMDGILDVDDLDDDNDGILDTEEGCEDNTAGATAIRPGTPPLVAGFHVTFFQSNSNFIVWGS